jgi:hypothetical protein
MTNENSKFSVAAMMAYDAQRINYAVRHGRGTGVTRASQFDREKSAAQPLPKYIPQADNRGQNNTGRIWRF